MALAVFPAATLAKAVAKIVPQTIPSAARSGGNAKPPTMQPPPMINLISDRVTSIYPSF